MEDGIEYEVDLDVGYRFDSIEEVCIKTEAKEGYASSSILGVKGEPVPGFVSMGIRFGIGIVYSTDDPTPENPNLVPQMGNISICEGENSILAKNFLDGEGKFTFNVSGGYVDFWDFELVIEGNTSDTQLVIVLDESAEFSVLSTEEESIMMRVFVI
ncbi:hypothetical protein [Microbulbifer sp. TRSA005]|uniref:hypothetical protein n=1 Tax=unclassified Microbulbifer TaxID=2619833 RepID=UPI0040395987